MTALPHIILPDSGADLLRLELEQAFTSLGCRVSRVHPDHMNDPEHAEYLPRLLERTAPALVFSINFQGLGKLKWILEETGKAGSQVAAWFVDNPWNILSGVRDPRWKDIPLFVTDAAFIPDLTRHGAKSVFHLPLAAWPEGFSPSPAREAKFPAPHDLAPVVFVGRSAFPGREAFFAGQSVPSLLMEQAAKLLETGSRPDLNWWIEQLGISGQAFWPGKILRRASLGAEDASLAWRAECLAQAAMAGEALRKGNGKDTGLNLDIFGDSGWQNLLPQGARVLPPVDYYARLPGIYKKARYSLALTSLQLPQGLNQRHFDVWLAGGFCLTDKTPGLRLFPPELGKDISFARPAEIPALVRHLEQSEQLRADIQGAWVEHLVAHHTYHHRAETVLESLGAATK